MKFAALAARERVVGGREPARMGWVEGVVAFFGGAVGLVWLGWWNFGWFEEGRGGGRL